MQVTDEETVASSIVQFYLIKTSPVYDISPCDGVARHRKWQRRTPTVHLIGLLVNTRYMTCCKNSFITFIKLSRDRADWLTRQGKASSFHASFLFSPNEKSLIVFFHVRLLSQPSSHWWWWWRLTLNCAFVPCGIWHCTQFVCCLFIRLCFVSMPNIIHFLIAPTVAQSAAFWTNGNDFSPSICAQGRAQALCVHAVHSVQHSFAGVNEMIIKVHV